VGCWNWFKPGDQQRDQGEPAIIAGLTRRIAAALPIDPRRIYVAGLSAGGAMTAIMTANYPDLYAAAGIHSGLPHAAAYDVISALMAMRKGPVVRGGATPQVERTLVPTIVFHGDGDKTVHPSNADHAIPAGQAGGSVTIEAGRVEGGHRYTRTLHRDAAGRCDAEHWLVHGAAHAWSGGNLSGSFTDPLGPDASAQMLRFFAEHVREE
jgi:poly(3-hydroxybutyrate) depolymerase